MKKKLFSIISLTLIIGMFVSCMNVETSESDSSTESVFVREEDEILDESPKPPDFYMPFYVREANGYLTEGYGCQVDAQIFDQSYTDAEIEECLARIDDMELQSVRTQIFPEWYERVNDNDSTIVFDRTSENVDFNSIEMQWLYRLLDVCEERDIKVELSFGGCDKDFKSKDGKINGSWLANSYEDSQITAPKLEDENGNAFSGYEEYAEAVYAVLDYLINAKNYTCISSFSLFPELSSSFLDKNGVCNDAEYVEFCKKVKVKLEAENLWNKVTMVGPEDSTDDLDKYKGYVNDLNGVFTANISSVYKFNDNNTNDEMYEYASNYVQVGKEKGNTWGVSAFGTNRYTNDVTQQSDIDSYDRAIFLARMAINFTNAGCTSINYSLLNDIQYGDKAVNLGLWKGKSEGFNARPQYYVWSLITKYTDIGSDIYPMESSDAEVCMVAYRLPCGAWTYLMANSGNTSKRVCILSLHSTAQKVMNVYTVSEDTLPTDNRTVTSTMTNEMKYCALSLTLPANSFTVISNKS